MQADPNKVKAIFLAAIENCTPKEWDAYLDQVCEGDAELRRRVNVLLRAHVGQDTLFDASQPESLPTVKQPVSEGPGAIIGPYKLLQKIGEGGMGVVYMADQTEPVKRRVALKIIKPGMDSRQVIARFEAERQALAMMDHPNIAKVLDADTTESGRPYFVMELVKGIPITKFSDENHLTPRERLELFNPVCQAVQHAHQKGIIHRDLKPSNVLVALYDGRPVPKVIDFGVAKATSQKLTERTVFTHYGQIVGTLEYMSPEQAVLNQLDIDTRSDIYALGVLLYELLTGTTPFDRQRLRSAAMDEMMRIIREEDPPKPSTRLSATDTLPSIAANRKTEPHKLSLMVRGELDWIVMKALEKDRGRRYETATAFAADVQRYLNDEAVEACPPSAGYRFRKFARRNKAVLSTVAAIAAILVLGIAASTWQAVRATHAEGVAHNALGQVKAQRDRAVKAEQRASQQRDLAREAESKAQQEAARANKETQRANAQARRAGEEAQRANRETQRAKENAERAEAQAQLAQRNAEEAQRERQRAESNAKRAESEQQRAEANVQLAQRALEEVYIQWAEQELTSEAVLDESNQKFLEKALPFYEELTRQRGNDRATRETTAYAYLRVARIYQRLGQYDASEQAFRKGIQRYGELIDDGSSNRDDRQRLAHCEHGLGQVLRSLDQSEEAEDAFRSALEHYRKLAGEMPNARQGLYRRDLTTAQRSLARLLNETGRADQAEKLQRQAVRILQQLVQDVPDQPWNRNALAWATTELAGLLAAGDEAERTYEEVQESYETLVAEEPEILSFRSSLGQSRHRLGNLLGRSGRSAEAEQVYGQAIVHYRKVIEEAPTEPTHRVNLADCLTNLANVLRDSDRSAEAEQHYREARDLLEGVVVFWPRNTWYRGVLCWNLTSYGNLLTNANRFEEAEQVYRQLVEVRSSLVQELPADVGQRRALVGEQFVLGDLLNLAGHNQQAADAWRHALGEAPGPYVDYNVRITTPGDYRLYLRAAGHDGASDSLAAQIVELADGPGGTNADWYIYGNGPSFLLAGDADFATRPWTGSATFEADNSYRFFDEPAVWTIPEPADYTVRVSMREDGAALDALVLQLASLPAPSQVGPPESHVVQQESAVDERNGPLFAERQGRVAVEAEHFASRVSAAEADRWVRVPTDDAGDTPHKNFRGDGYIQALPDDGESKFNTTSHSPLVQQKRLEADFDRYTRVLAAIPEGDRQQFLRREYERCMTRATFQVADLHGSAGRRDEAAQTWRKLLDQLPDPYVDYKLRITTPGVYRLHLRFASHQNTADTVYARIVELSDGPDGEVADWYRYCVWNGDHSDFANYPWQDTAAFERTDYGGDARDEPVEWVIPSAGDYTLRFFMREDGVALDAFVFQLAGLPTPTSNGPDESRRDGEGAFLESGGRAVAEAEHFTSRASGLTHDWRTVPDEYAGEPRYKNFRGGGYLQLLPDTGRKGSLERVVRHNDEQVLHRDLERYTRKIEAGGNVGQWLYVQAMTYERLGEPEKAKEQLDLAVARLSEAGAAHPDDIRNFHYLAKIHWKQKDYPGVVDASTKLIELESDHGHWWNSRGWAYKELEQYENAVADLSKGIELAPTRANWWNQRGIAWEKWGRYPQALADYAKALELNPRQGSVWNNRAIVYERLGRHEEAFANYSKALELNPKGSLIWANRAWEYTRLGEHQKAVAEFSEAIRLDGSNAKYWFWRGQVRGKLGENDKAVADFTKAIELNGDDPDFWYNRGRAYARLGKDANHQADFEKYVALLTERIERAPKNWQTWNRRGVAYSNLHEWDKARADYAKAIEVKPDAVLPWRNRAYDYCRVDQWEKAAADFSQTVELDAKNPLVYYWHALAWLGAGNADGYRRACAKMVERFGESDVAEHANWLAWTCALGADGLGDPALVVGRAQKALDAQPESDESLNTLGVALYRAGRYQEAVERLSEVTAAWEKAGHDPVRYSSTYTMFFLAMAHQRAGDEAEAARWLLQAVAKTDPVLDEQSDSHASLSWNRKLTLQLLKNEAWDAVGGEQRFIQWLESAGEQFDHPLLRARYYASRGRHEKAARDYVAALVQAPDDPEVADEVVAALAGSQSSAQAVRLLTRAIDAQPGSPELRLLRFRLKPGLAASWDFADGNEGWNPLNQCQIEAAEGTLSVQTTGADPYFGNSVQAPAGPKELALCARFRGILQAQLYWSTDKQPLAEKRSSRFVMIGDENEWREYRVFFEPESKLLSLRLDPANKKGLQMQIAWIALANRSLDDAIASDPRDWQLYDQRARADLGNDKVNEAISLLSAGIEQCPDRAELWELRGEAYGAQQRWREAHADFAKAIALGSTQRRLWHRRAMMFLATGDVDGYRRYCRDLIERFGGSDDPDVASYLAWCCSLWSGATDDPQQVVSFVEKAVAASQHVYYLYNSSSALYRAGRYGDAIERLHETVKARRNGAAPHDWMFLAMAHQRLGQADEARGPLWQAQQWLQRNEVTGKPEQRWGWRLELELLLREAEAVVAGREPNSEGIEPALRARLHLRAKRYDEAMAVLSDGIDKFPQSAELWELRGKAHADKKDYANAVADYSEALRLEPSSISARLKRSFANYQLQEWQAAIEDCTFVIAADPARWQVYDRRAWSLIETGDYPAAVADAGALIDGNAPDYWRYLGLSCRAYCDWVLGEYEKSLADAQRMIGINAERPEGHFRAGYATLRLGKPEEARAHFDKAVEVATKRNDAYWKFWSYFGRASAAAELAADEEAKAGFLQAHAVYESDLAPTLANPRDLLAAAVTCWHAGDQDKALQIYAAARDGLENLPQFDVKEFHLLRSQANALMGKAKTTGQ